MTATWICEWCGDHTRHDVDSLPETRGCRDERNPNGRCQWAVVRPLDNAAYQAITEAHRKPSWCKTCMRRGPYDPGHWPSVGCQSVGRPGLPVRPHGCTCNACF